MHIDLSNHAVLRDFYNDLLAGWHDAEHVDLLKDRIYEGVYANRALLLYSDSIFRSWTSQETFADTEERFLLAWDDIEQDQGPERQLKGFLRELGDTRQVRWARLAAGLGMPVPSSFSLYRGVSGPIDVLEVIRAWSRPGNVRVPTPKIASWSLRRQAAELFAGNEEGVVFNCDVPFERTLADIFVDDGGFLEDFWHECEVITAARSDDAFTADRERVVVWFRGCQYRHDELPALIEAWQAEYGGV